jgi:hypothetical protein
LREVAGVPELRKLLILMNASPGGQTRFFAL